MDRRRLKRKGEGTRVFVQTRIPVVQVGAMVGLEEALLPASARRLHHPGRWAAVMCSWKAASVRPIKRLRPWLAGLGDKREVIQETVAELSDQK